MNYAWYIYWAGVCGTLGGLFLFLAIFGGIVLTIGTIAAVVNWRDNHRGAPEKSPVKTIVKLSVLWVFLAIFTVLIPDTKTVYMMIGAEMGQQMLQSKQVNQVFGDVYKLVENKLQKELSNNTKQSNNEN